ncbi:bifunctional DNA primase/polymerase [Nocardiopsis suaedae]|uniref:Bifunctional DNA primase/polymerase n=1 Tax=Nocardiopsis suaedae TaxID=3018444 RepID=A0ABT4TQN7_9ACTN|nr:bifunctional DNA primase/polymerase [Nocardiopsis suaedae]MDA2807000.1 bifunctional DNA primase/polymerase [Nocardiopsis suaedae]
MADVLNRRRRRHGRGGGPDGGMREAALAYAALGWPVVRGAAPSTLGGRACGCDRIGCPDPAAHPVSAAWAVEATTDADTVDRWWSTEPEANVILPTGRVFDVFDVPAGAGVMAMARMDRGGVSPGPVAAVDARRYLFFVATRSPADEDEWWSCHLDCVPETLEDTPGLRWHCRNSYVTAAPSLMPGGERVAWIRSPQDGRTLPDPIAVLDVLADACEEFA